MKLPLGYRYSAVYAGIRKVTKDDLALIVSDTLASGAAVFTQNRVQAAPVRIARWNLTKSRGLVSAVLINAAIDKLVAPIRDSAGEGEKSTEGDLFLWGAVGERGRSDNGRGDGGEA